MWSVEAFFSNLVLQKEHVPSTGQKLNYKSSHFFLYSSRRPRSYSFHCWSGSVCHLYQCSISHPCRGILFTFVYVIDCQSYSFQQNILQLSLALSTVNTSLICLNFFNGFPAPAGTRSNVCFYDYLSMIILLK